MGSVFMGPHFKAEPVSALDMKIASLAWGFTIGFSILTCAKAGRQTIKSWRRAKGLTVYVVLIWSEMLVSTIFGIICWLHLDHVIPPSFAFYFTILTLWALQVQFLLQIIINRIALLIPNKRKVMYIKWGVAALITAVNISVYNIWVPARLQTNERYIEINEWWDRCEKGIYLICDGILNAYFLYLVKSRLLTPGMIKYKPVFKFNAAIVVVSLSMDVLIIAMMSLQNTFTYMQFHPVAYIVKLNIELTMAELISKVAKEPHKGEKYGQISSGANQSGKHGRIRSWTGMPSAIPPPGAAAGNHNRNSYINIYYDRRARDMAQRKGSDTLNGAVGGYQAWVDAKPASSSDNSTVVGSTELTVFPKTVRRNSTSDLHESNSGYDLERQAMMYNDNAIVKTTETKITSETMNDVSIYSDSSSTSILPL